MPPPTRMNMASSAAPKPKPSSTSGAFARYSSTTTAAPNSPRPTGNIPATPPVRNAIRNARRSPPSRAAAATRTLPRTVSDMPVNPVNPENKAPTRKKMLRPHITPAPPAWGSTSSTKKMTTTNTPRVLHRERDLLHPLGPLAGREHLPHQHAGHAEREQPDDRDNDHPDQVRAAHADGIRRQRRDEPEHSTSWN